MMRFLAVLGLLVLAGCHDSQASVEELSNVPANSPASKLAKRAVKTTAAQEPSVVTLTPAALAKVVSVKPEVALYLRITLTLGGCDGFIHGIEFADEYNPEQDIVERLEGISILVDKKSAKHLRGTTLDFITTAEGRQGFVFNNPNKRPAALPSSKN